MPSTASSAACTRYDPPCHGLPPAGAPSPLRARGPRRLQWRRPVILKLEGQSVRGATSSGTFSRWRGVALGRSTLGPAGASRRLPRAARARDQARRRGLLAATALPRTRRRRWPTPRRTRPPRRGERGGDRRILQGPRGGPRDPRVGHPPAGPRPDPQRGPRLKRRLGGIPKAFEAIARRQSKGPEAAAGGYMGTFERGQLPADLEAVAFALPDGGTSDPWRPRSGIMF